MAEQKQDDLHEHTYSSYVRIRDVALKTYQRRLGEVARGGQGYPCWRHDMMMMMYIYIYIIEYIVIFSTLVHSHSFSQTHEYIKLLSTYIYVHIFIYSRIIIVENIESADFIFSIHLLKNFIWPNGENFQFKDRLNIHYFRNVNDKPQC